MTSRLATHPSPYLRAAAVQPIDWYPWGPEPFARARELNRPILLDVGAAWCHWCHVMDHESYEDPAIGALLDRDWICIKVDRDERPDVDARYQQAVQALTGQGGWPLTAFLTAEGEVFYGGTYFPPDGAYGRPGFRTLLVQLANAYRTRRAEVAEQAASLTQHVRAAAAAPRPGGPTPGTLAAAARAMERAFDARSGGFGSEPKFPHPGAGEFLLARWHDTREAWLGDIVHRTLVGMARGGIRDHVGGGFHRYAVDGTWTVPHFEKMAYDNAELLAHYAHAAMPGAPDHPEADRDLYRDVLRQGVDWILRDLAHPEGGYGASQDADAGPDDDGDFFTWTVDEARAALTAEQFDVLRRCFDVGERGEMRHDPRRNVLWLRETPEEVARDTHREARAVRALFTSGREALLDARSRRTRPLVDRTIYTGWNGLMASAMLRAGLLLDRPDAEDHALDTLERLFRDAGGTDGAGGLRRAVGSSLAGVLEDQTYVARAAVDAYEATGAARWIDRAAALMDHVWQAYRLERGGLSDTPCERGGEGFLDHAIVQVQDAPTPSANGVAAIVLARLAALTGETRWTVRRDELLQSVGGAAADLSVFGSTILQAIDWAEGPLTIVAVVGPTEDARRLARAARAVYRPRRAIRWIDPGAAPVGLPEPMHAMLDGRTPRAYVCAGTQCAPPAATPEELRDTLATFAVGG